LRLLVEQLRRYWVVEKLGHLHGNYLLNTKPLPVIAYKRRKSYSAFSSSANYGQCASRKMNYFGYKLVVISTVEGLPVFYDLVPASLDERLAAE
jgi:hypothetical protein